MKQNSHFTIGQIGKMAALALACLLVSGPGCARYQSRPLEPGQTARALESRSLADDGLRRFLEQNGHSGPWPRATWNLETLTLAALYFSPDLEIARAQWDTTKAGVRTAGQRPNPTVGISPQYNSTMAAASPWIAAINLEVPLKTASKRRLRIAHAESLSDTARLRLGVVAWGVRARVRSAVLDLSDARERIEILNRVADARQTVLAAWENRLALGAATANETAAVRLAVARAQSDLAAAQPAVAEARATLAAALAVPLSGLPPEQALDPSFVPDAELSLAEARRRALTSRQDLLAGLADYAAADAALRLEIARQYPDVHLNPGYEYDQGENKWMLGLSLELPLLNRNEGPIAEAQARRREAGARVIALQAAIMAELERALAAEQTAAKQIQALTALRAAQEQQLRAWQAQLEIGALERIEVLQAEAELSALALPLLGARAQHRRAQGALEDALQRPLNPAAIETASQFISP